MYHSKYWLNLKELWTGFPHRSITGLFKWYYLAQLAFWLQQILVVNIEERRKDHWQMFTHHIVTSLLIIFSYGYYQTKVGNLILCLMDVVDLTLPVCHAAHYREERPLSFYKGCQDTEVYAPPITVRHCFWHFHCLLVPCPPSRVPQCMLVRRCGRSLGNACVWMFLESRWHSNLYRASRI